MTVLRSGSATDVGRVRTTNQDVALEDPDLFAVADGMGGAVGGDVAARVAVDALRAAFQREPTVEGLRHAIAEANRAVWRQGQAEAGLRGMGTTLTATGLVQEPGGQQVVALANVGDSRAYVFSRGQVLQVTADHSLAEEKVRLGELTEAEAAVHPHRHILTRVLGVNPDVDVDLWALHLKDGDRILLCSDGLTNEVPDDRIRAILSTVADPRQAAASLVKAAVEHGGSDNVTVVVVDVDDSETRAGSLPGTGAAPAAGSLRGGATTGSGAPTQPAPGTVPGVPAKRTNGPGATSPAVRERAGERAAGVGGAGGTDGQSGAASAGEGAEAGAVTTRGFRRVSSNAADGSALSRTSGPGSGGAAAVSALSDRRAALAGLAGRRSASDEDDDTDEDEPFATGPGTSAGVQVAELRRWQPTRNDRKVRHQKRHGTGAPRLITVRLVIFFVLIAAIVAAAYALVRWYGTNDWYVGLDHQHLAVYQGRPGGFLWFKPQLVDESPVTIHEVPGYTVDGLRRGRQEPSLKAAQHYVTNLHQEYRATRPSGSSPTTSSSTSSTSSPGTAGSGTTASTAASP
ncbi:MAG: Stp1/IreP family PP2C-type Ser/Thr phosphatase [Acidimicrobiales bacterium]